MMRELRPNTQEDVEDVISTIFHGRRTLTTAEINHSARQRIRLVPADLERAAKRPNETKIDQIISNALQDRRRLCREGLIERVDHGEFHITDKSRAYVAEQERVWKDAYALLEELFPDEKWND
ncbi:hypothetical protein AB3M93_19855 [Novosphingobium panipatense]|uniref:hypothetical protein n=1 Tax=Novosphingobium panipatense TaxID=428991 RepID=UPI0039A2524B